MIRRRKPKGPKQVSYQLIPRDSDHGKPMYGMLRDLVVEHHDDDLRNARIVLAWCTSWKPDVDGRVTIGKCKKASDLDRELIAYDFIILLSRMFWQSLVVTDDQRRALLDHELHHAALTRDKQGEPVIDERGRYVYRIRKHDIEEFGAVVERHGCYKRDLEQFAMAIRRSALKGFEPCAVCRNTPTPGWVATAVGETEVMTRCACWRQWQALRAEAAEVATPRKAS